MLTDSEREQIEQKIAQASEEARKQREQGGSTYADHYHSDLGGRFARQQPEAVTGRAGAAQGVPPQSGYWAGADLGVEPALGYVIDAVDIGEPPQGAVFRRRRGL